MLLTATLQSTNLGTKLVVDATSMVEVREKELGAQEELNDAVGKLPSLLASITESKFDDMCLCGENKHQTQTVKLFQTVNLGS